MDRHEKRITCAATGDALILTSAQREAGYKVSGTTNSFGGIIVMGVSGCGKSTVGRLLADTLGCQFIEGDELHDAISIAKMRAGKPLTDDDRWPWLDRLGNALQAATVNGGTVVATCSSLKKIYRERLSHAGATPTSFILLDASYQELLKRMENRPGHFMPSSLLTSQLQTLERPTHPERSLTLDSALPPAEMCEAIRCWLTGGWPH